MMARWTNWLSRYPFKVEEYGFEPRPGYFVAGCKARIILLVCPELERDRFCKAASKDIAGSSPATSFVIFAGVAQMARASVFQTEGCEFNSRRPLWKRMGGGAVGGT